MRQGTHSVAGFESLSAVPGSHWTHGPSEPAGANWPEEQEVQGVSPFRSESVLPAGQGRQTRSEVAVWAWETSEPAGHTVSREHARSEDAVFAVLSYSSSAHTVRGAQMRSEVAVAWTLMNWKDRSQVVRFAQAVSRNSEQARAVN